METVKIRINIKKEMRALYNKIKKTGLEHNGIIYGGMVRDEIISTYYKSIFDEYVKKELEENKLEIEIYKKFWDVSYHPESIKRMLIPCDMDIYFKNNTDASIYIGLLTEYSRNYNGIIDILDIPNTLYSLGTNFNHKKIRLDFLVGRTITYRGYRLSIKIDIIINKQQDYKLEPPFNITDFTSNLFVMEKNNTNNYDIRLSRNTGTPLDSMNYILKKRYENKILDDMLKGETEFIRKIDSLNSEYINGLRIMKMINKGYKITNILFREIERITNKDEYKCDICFEILNKDTKDKLIEILTNKYSKNIMHKECFMKYLYTEIYKRYTNNTTGEIECRCPRRNAFNFKNSYKYSSIYL